MPRMIGNTGVSTPDHSPTNRATKKRSSATTLAATMSLAAAAMLGVKGAEANQVTATVIGTITSGADTERGSAPTGTGAFGPVGSLTGKNIKIVYVCDDSKGTESDTYTGSTLNSTSRQGTNAASPCIATVTIGGSSVTIGTGNSPNSSVQRTYIQNYTNNESLGVFESNPGNNVSITVNPSGSSPMVANPDWHSPFTASQISSSGTGFDYTIQRNANDTAEGYGNFTATSITVNGPLVAGTSPSKNLGDPACDCKVSPFKADPINITTGNVHETVTDYESDGFNKLSFTRSYNSQSNTAWPQSFAQSLGTNWRHNFDRYLNTSSASAQTGASTVQAERPGAQVVNFTLNGSTWGSDSDVDIKLTRSGSTWTLTDHNDTVETYTDLGTGKALLTSVRERDGYTQNLTYSGTQLQQVTDSNGHSLTFTYSGSLLNTVTTPGGLVMTYGYSASGVNGTTLDRLAAVTFNTNPATSITYVYEDTRFPFAMTGQIDELGQRYSTWAYDAYMRGTSSKHGTGSIDLTTIAYNDTDGSRTVTNPLGGQEVYKTTMLQGISKITEIDRLANGSVPAAQRLFTFDTNGYLASDADWNGNETTYVNDTRGEPTTITEAAGKPEQRVTTISYHPTWHLPMLITAPTHTTAFTYDGNGNQATRTVTDPSTGTSRVWTNT